MTVELLFGQGKIAATLLPLLAHSDPFTLMQSAAGEREIKPFPLPDDRKAAYSTGYSDGKF